MNAGFRLSYLFKTACKFCSFSCNKYRSEDVNSDWDQFLQNLKSLSAARYSLWRGSKSKASLIKFMAQWNKFFHGPLIWRSLVYIAFNIILYYIICASLGIRELLKP